LNSITAVTSKTTASTKPIQTSEPVQVAKVVNDEIQATPNLCKWTEDEMSIPGTNGMMALKERAIITLKTELRKYTREPISETVAVRKSTMLSPSNSEFACMMLNTLPQPTIFG
jgi:hypothetical protein